MADLPTPNNRQEKFLSAIATGDSDGLPTPITREEVYLSYIAENGSGGGGGGKPVTMTVNPTDEQIASYPAGTIWLEEGDS